MAARPLPYRMRVPLSKLLAKKGRITPGAQENGAVGGEQIWSELKPPNYLQLILTSQVYDCAKETPLHHARVLSDYTGNKVFLKREDMQPGFSFKIRGAYNLMSSLTPNQRAKGVVSCALGDVEAVALAAKQLGINASLVVPSSEPQQKVDTIKQIGCEVVMHGSSYEDACDECARISQETGRIHLPSFDDPMIIAGQGTVGLEIVNQHPKDLFAIFCHVGGGSLLSGVAAYVKAVCPEVKVIGVETEAADVMTRSLEKGHRVRMDYVDTFAKGSSILEVGRETFRLCDTLVDDMVVVSNDEVCAAIKEGFEDTRTLLEPSGAISIAGMKKFVQQNDIKGENIVAITSGANMMFDGLRHVADRALLGESREALISIIMPEVAGQFKKLYNMVHPRSVTEFIYRYSSTTADSTVFMGFEPDSKGMESANAEVEALIAELNSNGCEAINISNNEMAKSHARFLASGRVDLPDERLYRFEFPEQPGALKHFLDCLPSDWNVSLFHYRAVGGNVGKVLAGLQIPGSVEDNFATFAKELGYSYVDETDNYVYKRFLK